MKIKDNKCTLDYKMIIINNYIQIQERDKGKKANATNNHES